MPRSSRGGAMEVTIMAKFTVETLDDFTDGILDDTIVDALDMYRERLEDGGDPDDIMYDAVADAIDAKFIYWQDMASAVIEYGKISDAFQMVYEDLFADVMNGVTERADENAD